jgi:hypothetical protein
MLQLGDSIIIQIKANEKDMFELSTAFFMPISTCCGR